MPFSKGVWDISWTATSPRLVSNHGSLLIPRQMPENPAIRLPLLIVVGFFL
jgi:hypothetical protein